MNSFKNTGVTNHNEILREKGRERQRQRERERPTINYLESSSTCSIRDGSISEYIKLTVQVWAETAIVDLVPPPQVPCLH